MLNFWQKLVKMVTIPKLMLKKLKLLKKLRQWKKVLKQLKNNQTKIQEILLLHYLLSKAQNSWFLKQMKKESKMSLKSFLSFQLQKISQNALLSLRKTIIIFRRKKSKSFCLKFSNFLKPILQRKWMMWNYFWFDWEKSMI